MNMKFELNGYELVCQIGKYKMLWGIISIGGE